MNPHPTVASFCHTAECGYVFGMVPEAKKKKTGGGVGGCTLFETKRAPKQHKETKAGPMLLGMHI